MSFKNQKEGKTFTTLFLFFSVTLEKKTKNPLLETEAENSTKKILKIKL